jgi:hypothetical protein
LAENSYVSIGVECPAYQKRSQKQAIVKHKQEPVFGEHIFLFSVINVPKRFIQET